MVRIPYDITINGETRARELPFVVGVLADLAGMSREPLAPFPEREFMEVRAETFDRVLACLTPALNLKVENTLLRDGSELCVQLQFSSLKDFEPHRVALQVEPLRRLLEARTRLADLRRKMQLDRRLRGLIQHHLIDSGAAETLRPEAGRLGDLAAEDRGESPDEGEWEEVEVEWDESGVSPNLLGAILDESAFAQNEDQQRWGRESLEEFVVQWRSMGIPHAQGQEVGSLTDAMIANLDVVLSRQINAILHHPSFQRLHAAWLGLREVVLRAQAGRGIVVKALHATKRDLFSDMAWAHSLADTHLYRKVYREHYDTIGAAPFGVLVGDYEFDNHPKDIGLLRRISQVAAAAPGLLGFKRFALLREVRDPSTIFQTPDYHQWEAYREDASSRYVGLCLPRVLMRRPFARATDGEFGCDEEADTIGRNERLLWGNPAYLLASCLIGAFASQGWCGSILGVEGGGCLPGQPAHSYASDAGDMTFAGPCEVVLTNDQEEGLARLGFIPVMHYQGTDAVVFLSAPSCHRTDPTAGGRTPGARLSCLTSSRPRASPTTSRRSWTPSAAASRAGWNCGRSSTPGAPATRGAMARTAGRIRTEACCATLALMSKTLRAVQAASGWWPNSPRTSSETGRAPRPTSSSPSHPGGERSLPLEPLPMDETVDIDNDADPDLEVIDAFHREVGRAGDALEIVNDHELAKVEGRDDRVTGLPDSALVGRLGLLLRAAEPLGQALPRIGRHLHQALERLHQWVQSPPGVLRVVNDGAMIPQIELEGLGVGSQQNDGFLLAVGEPDLVIHIPVLFRGDGDQAI
jgi:type VI secretion system protein ImpC